MVLEAPQMSQWLIKTMAEDFSGGTVHGWPQVQWAVGKGAVQPVLHAVAPCVRLVDAGARLVVAQVVLALRVPGRPVQVRTPGGRGRCMSGPRGHRGVHLLPGWLARVSFSQTPALVGG